MLPAEQLLKGGVAGLDLGLRRTSQEVMLLREVHRVRSG